MSNDTKMRELERKAALGDQEAQDRLAIERQRSAKGRHADKIGEWVLVMGFRDHFRGRLVGITELGSGRAIGHFHPFYWVGNAETRGGELKRPSTMENPSDLYLEVQEISLQPPDWPRS